MGFLKTPTNYIEPLKVLLKIEPFYYLNKNKLWYNIYINTKVGNKYARYN